MTGYLRIMFLKDPDAIYSQKSSQIAKLLEEPSPGDDISPFFLGFRLVDSSTGLTFHGSENTISAKMEHKTQYHVENESGLSEPEVKQLPLVSCSVYHDYILENYGIDDKDL
jgi:hypothetical protein